MGARHVGIGPEVTYGTAVAPTVFFEAQRESVKKVTNFYRQELVRAQSVREVSALSNLVEGEVEFVVDYETIGDILYYMIGTKTTSGAGPYTHVIPNSTTGLSTNGRLGLSFSLESRRDGALSWRAAGCKMESLRLSAAVDSILMGTAGILGKSTEKATPATATFPSTFTVARPTAITVELDDAVVPARSFELNINWPVDRPQVLGSQDFGTMEPVEDGVLSVAGSFDVYYDSAMHTAWDKFANVTDAKVEILCNSGSGAQLNIAMAKCRITQATPEMDGRKRLMSTFEFESFFNTSVTENVVFTVINGQATIGD